MYSCTVSGGLAQCMCCDWSLYYNSNTLQEHKDTRCLLWWSHSWPQNAQHFEGDYNSLLLRLGQFSYSCGLNLLHVAKPGMLFVLDFWVMLTEARLCHSSAKTRSCFDWNRLSCVIFIYGDQVALHLSIMNFIGGFLPSNNVSWTPWWYLEFMNTSATSHRQVTVMNLIVALTKKQHCNTTSKHRKSKDHLKMQPIEEQIN